VPYNLVHERVEALGGKWTQRTLIHSCELRGEFAPRAPVQGRRWLRQAKFILYRRLQLSELTRRLFVGIDWESETHHVCVVNSDGQIVEDPKVRQSADGLAEFLQWLSALRRIQRPPWLSRSKYRTKQLWRCYLNTDLKFSRSNPKQLDRFRDRFSSRRQR
jgi:hypothetical protein